MKNYSQIILMLSIIYLPLSAMATERQPSLKLKAEDNWLFGKPTDYSRLEQFYQKHGDCQIGMFGWFIYDPSLEKRLDPETIKQRFPDLAGGLGTAACALNATAIEMQENFKIVLPSKPGPMLFYIDFYLPDYLSDWLTPEQIAVRQSRLDDLGAYRGIPKYYILTPFNKGK